MSRPPPFTLFAFEKETLVSMRNTLVWAVTLFALWCVLSGKLDALHLGMGAAVATAIALATRPLLALAPAIGPSVSEPLPTGLVLRFLAYVPWLVTQIVISSFQVAWVVLHPRLPIAPRLVRLETDLPHPLARLTLANSITLTPGTVTLDADSGHFLVHALTKDSASGLAGAAGGMVSRVRGVFAPHAERKVVR